VEIGAGGGHTSITNGEFMDINAVEQYLRNLQKSICDRLTAIDGSGSFEEESWERPEGGGGVSRVLAGGSVFE